MRSSEVGHHLGFAHTPWTTRNLRPRMEESAERGHLSKTWVGRRNWYALTSKGTFRLREAREEGEVPPLPESPQHRAWRRARRIAEENRQTILDELRAELERAADQIDLDPEGFRWLESEPIFDLCLGLHWNLWRLGTAVYCLNQWTEPDDAAADPRAPRREALPHPPDAAEHLSEPTPDRYRPLHERN